jgi:hypothetical protein
MHYSPTFLKFRAIAFFSITIISIIWIVLLCFELFWRWDITDKPERSLILVIIVANAITVILLPILMLLQFRPWLDAARVMSLLIAHTGTAVMFTIWNPKFQCLHQIADEEGVCRMINMFILIGAWVHTVLLFSYASGLFVMVRRRSQQTAVMTGYQPSYKADEEVAVRGSLALPTRHPELSLPSSPFSVTFFPVNMSERMSFTPENGIRWDTSRKSFVGEGFQVL